MTLVVAPLVPPFIAAAGPITRDVAAPVVIRLNPVRTSVRRPRPVPVMPPIVFALREPVALHPYELGAGPRRHDVRARRRRRFLDYDGCRRMADHDADGHL